MMRARADARGTIERRGPTWWLRRRVEVADPQTGEVRLVRRRERLGPVTELRTHRQARAAADEWIERTRAEPLMPGAQIKAIAYFAHFQKVHLQFMRPTSRAVYRSVIRKHIAPAIAGLRLVDLDTAWVTRFLAARADTMRRASLMNLRRVVLQVLQTAVRDKYGACRITTRDVKIPRVVKAAKPQRFFTAEELERILEASEFPWRALWALMGYAGLRSGEALALAWEDVNFEIPLLTVRQNAVRGQLGAPKTKTSSADVPILPQLRQVLVEYQHAQFTNGPPFEFKTPSGLLFRTRAGTPYQTDDVRRYRLKPLLECLGIAPAGLHAFRHSVPRMLHAKGVSVKVISQVMRHGSTAQTENYLHTLTSDVWTSLEKAGLGYPQTAARMPHVAPAAPASGAVSGAP